MSKKVADGIPQRDRNTDRKHIFCGVHTPTELSPDLPVSNSIASGRFISAWFPSTSGDRWGKRCFWDRPGTNCATIKLKKNHNNFARKVQEFCFGPQCGHQKPWILG